MAGERLSEATIIGLGGGMGSGKSTVSNGFIDRGLTVLDADKIVREDLQHSGHPVLDSMATILGEEIILESGELDRTAAGRLMFADDDKRRAIDNLIHPLVWEEIRTGIGEADPEDIVVLDVPLLFEALPDDLKLDGTIVVDTFTEVAVGRLVLHRGVSEEDARARIAKQMSREERLARADYVIRNNGSKEALEGAIESAVQWAESLR